MPRPKRIRNLLKSVPITLEIQHTSYSSEHSLGNYVEVTSRKPNTQFGQLGQQITQPTQQRSETVQPSFEPIHTNFESAHITYESEQTSSQSAPNLDSVHATFESQTQRVDPKKTKAVITIGL